MSTTLPLYYTLASPSTSERLDASVSLLSALERFQVQHALPPSTTKESDPKEQFEALNAPDVQYAVNRLVKGLASSREQSRIGFAVALTELLQNVPTIHCSHVLSLILTTSMSTGSMSGFEQRDMLFARLFGLTSLVQSGLLFRSQPPAVGSSTLKLLPTLEDFQTTVRELVNLGDKKTWLRESAWWAVLQAVDGTYASEVAWKREAIAWLCAELFEENKEWSLEKLALGVRMQRLDPELKWGKLVSPTFKQSNLLGAGNLSAVARIFKGMAATEDQTTEKNPGWWKPQLHFAWDVILDSYFSTSKASQGSLSPPSEFQDFFRLVVDESLFASTASDVRKSWGFQVFAKALPKVPTSQLPLLFTRNFMRVWINHLSKPDRFLHKAALGLVDEIRRVAGENSSVGLTLVAQLTGKNGNQRFDQITKTKTVQSLVDSLDAAGVQEYVKFLMGTACAAVDSDGPTGIDARRSWILDQLHSLLRNTSVPKNEDWVGLVLEFFLVHGFFIVKKASSKSTLAALHTLPEPLFSEALQSKCREKAFSVLTLLSAQQKGHKAKPLQNGKTPEQAPTVDWFARAVDIVQKLVKDKKHVMPVLEGDADVIELRTKALETISNLSNVSAEKAPVAQSVKILLQYLILQTYADDFDTADILPDSVQAISQMLGLDTKTSKGNEKVEAEPMDMIMDVLMALLESDTAHARELVGQVFSGLTEEALPSTIEFIIAQLESKRAGGDEESDEDEEEDSEVDMDSEAEPAANGEADGAKELSDSEETEDDSEEEESEEEDEEDEEQAAANAALRARLGQVLRANGVAADTDEDEDEDEEEDDDDDEEIVDDDAMLQLDDQLAAALRSQVVDKKGRKNAQREATHFKIRVVDLLEIFMKNEPTSDLLLQLIVPLLDIALFSSSDELQLSNRVTGVLNSRLGGVKEYPQPTTDEATAQILRDVYDRMRRAEPSPVTIHCCDFLCKVLSKQGKEANSAVVDIYRDALNDFVMRRSSGIPIAFFKKLLAGFSLCGWPLRQTILTLLGTDDATNRFNQRQLVDLVEQLLNALTNQNSVIKAPESEVTAFFESVRQTIYHNLSKSLDSRSFPTEHVRDLLKCLQRGIRASTKLLSPSADHIQAIWATPSFETLATRLEKEHSNVTSVRDLANQVMKLLRPEMEPTKSQKERKGKKTEHAADTAVGLQIVTNVVAEDRGAQAKTKQSKLKRSAVKMTDDKPPKKKQRVAVSS